MNKTKICIIGVGYIGLPLSVKLSDKFNVIGYDINLKRVKELNNNQDYTNEVSQKELTKSKILFNKPKYYESEHLSLDSSKSLNYLKGKTFLKPQAALKLAFKWYKFYYDNKGRNKKIIDFTFSQIKDYQKRYF